MTPRFFSLTLFLLVQVFVARAGTSLVENGSMDAGKDKPDQWTIQGKALVSRDTEVFKSAPASLRVELEAGSGGAFQRFISVPAEKYTVKGSVKAEGQFEVAQVALQYFDATKKQIGWKVVTSVKPGDWTNFEIQADPFPSAAATLLVVVGKGSGKIWLDDVVVETGAAATKPVAAADGEGRNPTAAVNTPEATVAGDKGTVGAVDATPLPQVIPANDPNLHYSGRFDFTDPHAPRCAWPACAVTIKFKGKSANVAMNGKSGARWQVVVDGVPGAILVNNGKPQILNLAHDLPPGDHTITLVKKTEALFGTVTITGFQLESDAQISKMEAPTRRIEVIGDSISAGFGDEAANQNEKFSPLTENANIAYGALAARAFQAEYSCVAWSGKKLWPDKLIPELYDLIIPTEAKGPVWDFSKGQPQVVVINLGTNDFSPGNPDETGWVTAYKEFIARIHKNYPDSFIFCAVSPMIVDKYSKSKDARTTITRYLNRVVEESQKEGISKVALLEFPEQTGALGFGAAWHPSARQHQAMAEVLEKAIREKVGW